MEIKPFEKKLYLASPTTHGDDEIKYVQEAFDTMMHTVNFFNATLFGCFDHARKAGVDNCSRSSGLADNHITHCNSS